MHYVDFLGRCVVEVRIGGVETEYMKRPYDYSVAFVLRSLLVIDALQNFGPEYRLLVSSQTEISHHRFQGSNCIFSLCLFPFLYRDDILTEM